MNSKRWAQIKPIFHAAAERPADERAAFIRSECNGDESLAVEIESLFAAHDQAGSFIEGFPSDETTVALEDLAIKPLIGLQIGPYKVISLIGRGGMGEVYLAQDSRLGRKVALKLLPARFTALGERVRRFEQEARSASSLNHPNIITVHDIGKIEGKRYLVTEYVEGETLRQRMESAPQQRIKLSEALEVATQVAAALAAAHEAGIVHRDIKPENIMLRTDGYVKVLDFGLAKLAEPKAIDTAAPTLPKVETEPGLMMGTVSYMSPEQARALMVDARTDIWSLGVMIYEMASGRQPFEGETASNVLSLILQKDPLPLAHSSPEVPGELERICADGKQSQSSASRV
ncbi:MAG: serine/threonine-protein kinase [Acidobacteriota bacterium]